MATSVANWIECPDGSLIQISSIGRVWVTQNWNGDGTWLICGMIIADANVTVLKSGYADEKSARAALATQITNLGGKV
jgi:hypothetical protein